MKMLSNSLIKPPSKKRKLRKGTRSCWECKRRKSRCTFSAETDATCLGCRQRGTDCISQEDADLAAESLENGMTRVSDRRLRRVEEMLETLVEGRGPADQYDSQMAKAISPKHVIGLSKIASADVIPKGMQPPNSPRNLTLQLSETLHTFLPSPDESQRLCASALFVPCFFQQLLTRDYLAICTSGCSPQTGTQLATLPSQNAHPVLIAQKLLMLACLTRYTSELESSMKSRNRAEEMARVAIEMVTTKDDLVRNAEGLECMMLEATYHLNNGHLRRAFSAVRRAMAAAQLLGIHRSLHRTVHRVDDRAPRFDPSHMWYRINYVDRLLCLILGLPQGSTDTSFAFPETPAALTPEQLLEREHSIIASRILDYNEGNGNQLDNIQSIDTSLQGIAGSLPSSWWLTPSLSTINSPREMFLSTTHLVTQLFHFNLINQTHLPNLLKPDPVDQDPSTYWYSKAACITASREILNRYIALQSSGFVAYAYHFIDFFTLIAAITMLLVHLDHHWRFDTRKLNVLSHMRLSDRATIQQVARHLGKPPTCKGPDMLEQLLAVEEEAFSSRTVASGKIKRDAADSAPFFELNLPYYGRLRVNSVKICFRRALDIEDLTSSIERQASPDCANSERPENLSDTVFEDWLNTSGELGAMQDPYGGTEMAFFDSFQALLQDTA